MAMLANYWRNTGESAWRRASIDPPPASPALVEWLEWPAGMPEGAYESRASMGELATHTRTRDDVRGTDWE